MHRLWLSAIECNYKEPDRQLKEQFIHSLDDTEMLVEIIRELTKIQENTYIMSENMLCWAKRVEAKRAPSAIMSSITKAKELNKLKIAKNTYKDNPRRSSTLIKTPAKQTCKYCGRSHPLIQYQVYGKRCTECSKLSHLRGVCRSRRTRAVNEVEQETVQDSEEESSIDPVNINSIHFNKNCLVITTKSKMSAGMNYMTALL